jgi:hypothetical protein
MEIPSLVSGGVEESKGEKTEDTSTKMDIDEELSDDCDPVLKELDVISNSQLFELLSILLNNRTAGDVEKSAEYRKIATEKLKKEINVMEAAKERYIRHSLIYHS